ncbi:hypothetical protein ACO9S2_10390 [Nitrospira sp. NS4]|uniref:hypothetical protein n=1 Tax=Nitrospira sp. NS4 TaxID=3414498 RepID=UPI003C30CB55
MNSLPTAYSRLNSVLAAIVIASSLFVWPATSDAAQITGLESPNSFVSDPQGKEFFISNINGDPDARDNNGFITKVDAEGKVLNLKFIQGGISDMMLHAPKGMALLANTLYVADLDQLKGFDKATGKSLVTVSFPPQGTKAPVSLTDVTAGPNGMLYASDQSNNAIYRIDSSADHRVSLLVHDERLAGPAGIAVHPRTGHIIAVSWEKGRILEITPEGQLTELVSNGFFTSRFQNLSGVDFDRWGNMYVSDFTKGKIWRMTRDNHFQVIAEYLPAPADISIDRANNLILVPYHYAHTAEINGLEAPSEGKSRDTRRTLADYGFGAAGPPKAAAEGSPKK